jgi:lipopolysaccharide export system ATP-binding protein
VTQSDDLPLGLRQLIDRLSQGDRSTALGLEALVLAARPDGRAVFNDVAIRYRDDYLELMRGEGRDVEREAGRLGLDEVRAHLATSVMPRLAADGVIVLPQQGLAAPDAVLSITEHYWAEMAQYRSELAEVLRHTSEHVAVTRPAPAAQKHAGRRSELTADGLVKTYRRRRVVNDVALRLQQGEIVGLLGPNGAGKTTTFYMIVGLIQPQAGKICFDGDDITDVPMYQRARRGIGYLSQEPSIFRKLTVEQNILAILETMDLSREQRRQRLEKLLDELSIKHLRHSRAFALSGGERRRLEITRALVTQPKFMMLDEPFAGVDPIAVHDIQSIVAGLRHRGIGVLISDHNVEQTLDIVDRAYIMFDGQVKVSGTVRELVFDDTVAKIYLGPTLTARLRSRFAASENGGSAV